MKDRRTARRYELSFAVTIDEEDSSRSGKTRDISTRGVYFTIDNDLTAGIDLDLTMALPSEGSTGGSEVFIKATGRVIRVDKRPGNVDGKIGVAAVFELPEIVRNETAIA
jgi:hypothetical protein